MTVDHQIKNVITANGIASVSKTGIGLIEDTALRQILIEVYNSPATCQVIKTAENLFTKLTSKKLPTEILCKFLSGWRATHGTALFVSGLMIRILREAENNPPDISSTFYKVAVEIGEIIPEDTGVDDTPHQELFAKFATYVAGNDNWRLDLYKMPACEQFRSYVQIQRLNGNIEEAILTTAASENWNTGEYTYFNGLIHNWMHEKLGLPKDIISDAASYVSVHAGNTELGHFLHALKAWKLYCKATGKNQDPIKVKSAFEKYINEIRVAYNELENILI